MPENTTKKSQQNTMNLVAPIIDVGRIVQPVLWKLEDEEKISVKILGNPMPVIRWQIGRRRVKESSRYSLQTQELKRGRGWQHTLLVKNVSQDLEQGIWVTAESEAGQDCVMIEVKTYSLLSGTQASPTMICDASLNDTNSVSSLNVWEKEMEKRNHMRSVDDLVENPQAFNLQHNTSFDPNIDPESLQNSRRKKKKSQFTKSASVSYSDQPQNSFSDFQRIKTFTDPTAALPPINVKEFTDVSQDIQSEPMRRKKRRDRLGSKVSAASEVSGETIERQDSDLSGYSLRKRSKQKDKPKSLDISVASELMVTDFDVEDISAGDVIDASVNQDVTQSFDVNQQDVPVTPPLKEYVHQNVKKKKKSKRTSSVDPMPQSTETDAFINQNNDAQMLNGEDAPKMVNGSSNFGIDEELFHLLGMDLGELCAKLLSGKFDPAGLDAPTENTFLNRTDYAHTENNQSADAENKILDKKLKNNKESPFIENIPKQVINNGSTDQMFFKRQVNENKISSSNHHNLSNDANKNTLTGIEENKIDYDNKNSVSKGKAKLLHDWATNDSLPDKTNHAEGTTIDDKLMSGTQEPKVEQKRKKYRLRLCVDPTALRSWIVH